MNSTMDIIHLEEEIYLPNDSKGMIFGLFDGHGEEKIALFAMRNFIEIF